MINYRQYSADGFLKTPQRSKTYYWAQQRNIPRQRSKYFCHFRSLVVLAESTARPQTSSSLSDRPQIGSFYLWCKKCGDLTRGKLRVYCSTCSSSAIIVQSEPTGWSDLVRWAFYLRRYTDLFK